ncbi:MAG: NfeD family protein [Muribaculaceae bacterium]|nr:NfeD family protein [Muribaculaceae bacterium]
MSTWIIWLIAGAVLLIIELLSGIVATLCMAVGCIAASLLALAGFGVEIQLAGMAASVILAFVFLAPLINRMRKRQNPDREEYNSNMNALIGRDAIVTKPFDGSGSAPGRARIDGDNWQVRNHDGSPLVDGERVRVIGYDSIILIVKPIKANQ